LTANLTAKGANCSASRHNSADKPFAKTLLNWALADKGERRRIPCHYFVNSRPWVQIPPLAPEFKGLRRYSPKPFGYVCNLYCNLFGYRLRKEQPIHRRCDLLAPTQQGVSIDVGCSARLGMAKCSGDRRVAVAPLLDKSQFSTSAVLTMSLTRTGMAIAVGDRRLQARNRLCGTVDYTVIRQSCVSRRQPEVAYNCLA
jgi:hypothetical protein